MAAIAKIKAVETDIGTFYVRRMSWADFFCFQKQRAEIVSRYEKEDGSYDPLSEEDDRALAYLTIAHTACDKKGKRLFANAKEAEEVDAQVAFRLLRASYEVGMVSQDKIEEVKKNSERTRS